jgi:hypothetical protein
MAPKAQAQRPLPLRSPKAKTAREAKDAIREARAALAGAYQADLDHLREALTDPATSIQCEMLAQNMVANIPPPEALRQAGFEVSDRLAKANAPLHSLITSHPIVGKRIADLLLQRSTMMLRESARQMVEGGLSADMVLGGIMRIATICMDPASFRPNIARLAFRDLGDHLGLFRDHVAPPSINPKLMEFVLRLEQMPEEALDKVIGLLMSQLATDVTPKPSLEASPPASNGHANGHTNGHAKPAAGAYDHLPIHARPPRH